MRNPRLGCLSGTGIIAALITAIVISGYAYARGGLLYNPGPLNAQSGGMLGGVTSHAETGGDCKACHAAPWETQTMADRCAACHEDIASQMKSAAQLHGVLMHNNPNLNCRHCHPEHRGAQAKLTVVSDGEFPHEVVGYSLTGHQLTAARESFTCDDCHHGDITTFASDSCETCHRQIDVAFAQAHLLEFGADCLACHDGVDRYGADFDHNRFKFQLTGKHTRVTCSKCHLGARTIADLQSAAQDCAACHGGDDPHEGRFGAKCDDCHSTDGWKPAKFDHDLAAFKLTGAHMEVKCEQCHINNVYRGAPKDCYACHAAKDTHNGKFGTDCAACHAATAWEDVTFDHNKSKFPLTGAHVNLACERCHVAGQFTGLSTACAACHADPVFHAGMFGSGCAQCHNTSNWFALYNGRHPAIADEGGRGVNHGGASCRTCHTQTLRSATCTACHSGNPKNEGGGD